MSKLEDIIARGNRGHRFNGEFPESTITCADGFTVSVIAGGGCYCTPRPQLCAHPYVDGPIKVGDWFAPKNCDYPGPYSAVEVGFPSVRPEPWGEWSERFEDFGDTEPTGGVYGYVPVDLVRALIASHGGEA